MSPLARSIVRIGTFREAKWSITASQVLWNPAATLVAFLGVGGAGGWYRIEQAETDKSMTQPSGLSMRALLRVGD
jgi:hypothetical protein